MFLGTSLDWLGWFLMLLFIVIILFRENKRIQFVLTIEALNNPAYQSYFNSVTQPLQRAQYRLNFFGNKKLREYNRFLQLSAELAHKIHQQETIEKKSRFHGTIHDLRDEIQTCLINLEK
jgi:hypothetical protein